MPTPFLPLDGPLRVEKWPGISYHRVVVNRLGIFQCDGPECVVAQLVEAFNAAHEWPDGEEKESEILPCPQCGFPIEEAGQEKCVSCRHPREIQSEPTVQAVKKNPQVATMDEWM